MNCGKKARELSSIDGQISHCRRVVIARYLTKAERYRSPLHIACNHTHCNNYKMSTHLYMQLVFHNYTK